MDDYSLMPFGKYKGTQLANVPASYLIWIYEESLGFAYPGLREYIKDNLHILKAEFKKWYT